MRVRCPDDPDCVKTHNHEDRYGSRFTVLRRVPKTGGREVITCACSRGHEHDLPLDRKGDIVELLVATKLRRHDGKKNGLEILAGGTQLQNIGRATSESKGMGYRLANGAPGVWYANEKDMQLLYQMSEIDVRRSRMVIVSRGLL